MNEPPDLEWLRTPEGREWLESDEGTAWLRSDEGQAWLRSADANQWFDELAQRGFEEYFSGQMPAPPDWAIMPDEAPRIGTRVRLTESFTTMGGAAFEEGELAIVSKLKLAPFGGVSVTLRTIDGRSTITLMRGTFVPATG